MPLRDRQTAACDFCVKNGATPSNPNQRQPTRSGFKGSAVHPKQGKSTFPVAHEMLAAFEFPTTDSPTVIRRATSLAIETNQHLFDTLYHAVALEHEDALLVTADERYYRKAEGYGTIRALHQWQEGS